MAFPPDDELRQFQARQVLLRIDHEVRLPDPPQAVLFYEAYGSLDALAAHSQGAHLWRFKLAREGPIRRERRLRQGGRLTD